MRTRPGIPLTPAILFAHRGGRVHGSGDMLDAFSLAITLGATGLKGDVWLTADHVPVLDDDGRPGHLLRRRPIGQTVRANLPGGVPSLSDLYGIVGAGTPVALDVRDASAVPAVLDTARRFPGAEDGLWLCHPDWETAASWRDLSRGVRLVDSTRLARITEGPERRAADLAAAGVDAVSLDESDWSAGLVALFHRFGIVCLGRNAQQPRQIHGLLRAGVDGLFGSHADRMAQAARLRPEA